MFTTILFPVLVQISLTLIVFLMLGVRKTAAIKEGNVDRSKTALDNKAWPDEVLKVSNNIGNQFQTPVLFYTLALMFHVTNTVNLAVLVMAWVYVISRLAHAYVHVGSNYVPMRFKLFTISVISLIIMTVLAFIYIPLF